MKINPAQLGSIKPLHPVARSQAEEVDAAKQLKQAYADFVGKTFFGQMLKSMRSTVGKPAYFHGGQAEETFNTMLDQHLADGMTKASAAQIADPMFARQFPQQAATLAAAEAESPTLFDLGQLRRY
ncbi:MAG TPA: rod-binding protein [Lacipirellulaceae bacterium]|nr:rod-binding protein [Lacipirellulaceae bacterium]